jgi:hypothetical protein
METRSSETSVDFHQTTWRYVSVVGLLKYTGLHKSLGSIFKFTTNIIHVDNSYLNES